MSTTFTTVVNNYSSLVSVGRSIGGPYLVVLSVDGLPVLTGGNFLRLSVFRNNVAVTILKVIAVDFGTGTLTIDGTLEMPDAVIQENDLVTVGDPAGLFTELQGAIHNIENGVTNLPVLANFSSVARTLNVRLSEVYNAKDWGAVGDGVNDDSPAINALIAYVVAQPSFKTRTIYFPAGNYALHSTIVVARSLGSGLQTAAIHFVGDGYQTQFFSAFPMTEVIRIEDCAVSIFERFRVLCVSSVSVAALHITAVTSGENNNFHEITVDCNNACPVGIGVSLDSDADTAQIHFWGCKVSNAIKAGIRLGNGTSGNVLDIRFWGCQSLHNVIGVWMDAAPIIWDGGATTSNSVSDFFLSAGMGGPTVIQSVRSENSNMFYLSRGGGSCPPIRISDIQCSGFIGQTYTYDDVNETFTPASVEGFVISTRYSGLLTIMNCSFWHGPVRYPGGRLDIGGLTSAAVINSGFFTAGGTATSYIGNNFAYGGKGTQKNYFQLGGKTVTTGGSYFDTPVNFYCDGSAFFNDVVAINTQAPSAQFHQRGGSFRLEEIADPVSGPTITQGGTPGSTSYTYYFVYKDQIGNKTLVSPAGSTSTGNATLDANNYNIVAIPVDNSVSTIDILRGDTAHSIVTDWNPYVTTPLFSYLDQSMATQAYTVPTRNGTADMTVDGSINIGDASAFSVLATGSTTSRTLAARFFEPYNVLDWGAKGDGVTDDQPAIMALLKYISNLTTTSSGARTVYFPAGSYMIGSATNSQGIMVGKRFMQKPDLSYPAAGTQWPGINLIGDGYSTQLVSNCPTGLTEILRIEDVTISRVQGFRFWVHPNMPVTTAALHITAISSGENHITEDIVVDIQPNAPFAVAVTNGSPTVTGSGTSWTSTLAGKYMEFAGDSTHTVYLISAVNSSTILTLSSNYQGTTGNTTATLTVQGDGCPVGIAVSVDINNDSAQIHFIGCKVTGANYAGFMFGGGIVGNVLDIRCMNCQASNNPIGVFGWAAPFVWRGGALSFNYIADFYMNGVAAGPIYIDNVRSEGSNQFYKNNGGGTSASPTTLSNCSAIAWSGNTYAVNLNGVPPFFPINVSVTNGLATVTGIGTYFDSHDQVIAGNKYVFQNDSTGTAYTVSTINSDTSLTLSTVYAGPTNASTHMGLSAPSFTLNTQASVTGTTVVTVTNGSAVVTSTGNWTGSLTTNMYLVFASDPSQYNYSILSIDSLTQVTLKGNAKGNTVYIGPSGLTTVKCALVEGYSLVNRAGGNFNLIGLIFSHGPSPYLYARYNFAATNCFVNSIGCSIGSATGTTIQMRDSNYLGGGGNPSGTNFMVLPGSGNTSADTLYENDLGFLCGYQANFQRKIAVGAFNVSPTSGYHQQGGSIRLQAIPDPSSTPTVAVQGSAGSTTYYYKYVFRDIAGNVTMAGPSSLAVTTSQAYGSFTTSNYNKISIPVTPNVSNPSYVDILRSTDNATWTNVVHSTVSGSIQFGSTWSWNPWITDAMTASTIIFNDQSTTAPTAYTLPTRNATADLTIDGLINLNGTTSPYAGTGGGEINGAQTASVTDVTTTKMIQTLWNFARATGLVA